MSNQFEIVEHTIGYVIEIEERVPVWRMPATFGHDFKTISEYISSQGAEISGMPYAGYQEMDWDIELNRGKLATFFSLFSKRWHFYVGMPCSKELISKGKLRSKTLKSQRYVKGVHLGPYKECGDTYKALFKWASAQGVTLRNETIESYVNDPAEVKESEIETLILIPIKQ